MSPRNLPGARMKRLVQRFKQLLVALGAVAPRRPLLLLSSAVMYLRFGRWLADNGFRFRRRVATREECFAIVAEQIGHRPVLLLEFGVYRGDSLRTWSSLLTHPDTQLIGFDSFEGLPEFFNDTLGLVKGSFDVDGAVPRIDDDRVTFRKGWFEDTLDGFVPPEHDQLIVSVDADLYSSARTVLNALQAWIVEGTYLYFDDFAYVDHEPAAFAEFLRESGRRFVPVVSEWSVNRCVFRCVA